MESDPIQVSVVSAMGAVRPAMPLDDWEFEDELRSARRFVDWVGLRHGASEEEQGIQLHYETEESSEPPSRPPRRYWAAVLAWGLLSLGLAAFFFGGTLMLWAAVGGRNDLWLWSVPLVLAGQAAVFIGVVVLLDGLWQWNSAAAREMDGIEERLQQLRNVTLRLSATHSQPARDFYQHVGSGASPQVLLSDLKSQMDFLASQMAQDRRAA